MGSAGVEERIKAAEKGVLKQERAVGSYGGHDHYWAASEKRAERPCCHDPLPRLRGPQLQPCPSFPVPSFRHSGTTAFVSRAAAFTLMSRICNRKKRGNSMVFRRLQKAGWWELEWGPQDLFVRLAAVLEMIYPELRSGNTPWPRVRELLRMTAREWHILGFWWEEWSLLHLVSYVWADPVWIWTLKALLDLELDCLPTSCRAWDLAGFWTCPRVSRDSQENVVWPQALGFVPALFWLELGEEMLLALQDQLACWILIGHMGSW